MPIFAGDVMPFTQARSNVSEMADLVDYHRRLKCEPIHLLLIEDARRGLEDVLAGRTREADQALADRQKRLG